ncbi:MAG TPA: TIGR03067 domain-containing protein [Pirellulales bacterium]|jgi:uncharacterized protein (TIGR03067 family)|nr:TIGR03067 domain-containing protein [Pirellulales bacterium]
MFARSLSFGVIVSLVCIAAATAAESDEETLQGNWEIKSLEVAGQAIDIELVREKIIRDLKLTFQFGNLTLELGEGAEKLELPYTLDPAADPKRIDLRFGPDKGREGIYKLDGDKLEMLLGPDDKAVRPKDFSASDGEGFVLVVLERLK